MSAILKFIRENHILAIIEQTIAKKKSRLCLNAFEITEIPSLLYNCLDVEHLYLHKNKITIVPVHIAQLENLTTLTLDYNNITSLPAEIGSLKKLVNLNISYNPLKVLVPEIGELENLEAFWCNRIDLREIPKEIGKLSKLDTFGARGNKLKSLPDEITNLSKLRWLTLENNQLETIPDHMDKLESLVHCNLRNNRIREFPISLLRCGELMYLQLNCNEIQILPDEIEHIHTPTLDTVDMRGNPICETQHSFLQTFPPARFTDELNQDVGLAEAGAVSSTRGHAAHVLAVNATQLRLPAAPAPIHHQPTDPVLIDMDMDTSSIESSEDWENSVNSSEIDVQYQSDEERIENEAVGVVLPALSKFASTAS